METSAIIGLAVGIPISFIIGAILGYFISMKIIKKQLRKHPPITEAQVKAMYAKMGRKPSETQIKEIMRSFKNQL